MAIAQQEGATDKRLKKQEQEEKEIFEVTDNMRFGIGECLFEQRRYIVLPQLYFEDDQLTERYQLIKESRESHFTHTDEDMLVWNMHYTITSKDPNSVFQLHPLRILVIFQYSDIIFQQRKTKSNIRLPIFVPMAYQILEVRCQEGALNVPVSQGCKEIPITEKLIPYIQQFTFHMQSLEPYHLKFTNTSKNRVFRYTEKEVTETVIRNHLETLMETVIRRHLTTLMDKDCKYVLIEEYDKIQPCFPCRIPYEVIHNEINIGTIVLPAHHQKVKHYRALNYLIEWKQRCNLVKEKEKLALSELSIKKENLSYALPVNHHIAFSTKMQAIRSFEAVEINIFDHVFPTLVSESETLNFAEEPYYAFRQGANIISQIDINLLSKLSIQISRLETEEIVQDSNKYTCETYAVTMLEQEWILKTYKKKQQIFFEINQTVLFTPFFLFYYEKIQFIEKQGNGIHTYYISPDDCKSNLKVSLLQIHKEALVNVTLEDYQKEFVRLHGKKAIDWETEDKKALYGENMYTLLEKGDIVFQYN